MEETVNMKNIEAILTEAGIELTDEQRAAITKAVAENYKTVNEFTSKVTKLEGERDSWKDQYTGVKASLDKFDGVNVDDLKAQIAEQKKKAEEAEKNANEKLAARDYADAVKANTAGIKFSSAAAQRDFESQLQSKNLPVNDGKLLGFTDFLAQYKADNEGAVLDESAEEKAKFTDSMNSGSSTSSSKDSDLTRAMRAAMGLPDTTKKE